MDKGSCARRDDPPSRGPQSDIIRVKAEQSRHFLLLAHAHEGYEQHWCLKGKGYSGPHVDPKAECENCQNQYPLRWRAYIWVAELPGAKRFGHLELTEGFVNQAKIYLGKESWIGGRIEVRRGKGATSPLTLIFHEWIPAERLVGYPTNRPVLPVLEGLWEKGRQVHG